jgi:curved DNA-binding protein CbpA
LKDYYALLEIAPTAPPDEVKRAFRAQIARYHPDKVQHLGQEFQAMAAERAAELTEAYRILSHEERRAEYDRGRASGTGRSPAAAAASAAAATAAPVPEPPPPSSEAGAAAQAGASKSEWFSEERATRDEYVRKAILSRFRQALALAMGSSYDESSARGFDIAFVPKSKLFGRGKGPRLLGRFVTRVDADAVDDTWAQIGKLKAPDHEEVCVFLMGTAMAPRKELETAIFTARRKMRGAGAKVTVIPVDTRVWDAHMPVDAPDAAKNLLARLRGGT